MKVEDMDLEVGASQQKLARTSTPVELKFEEVRYTVQLAKAKEKTILHGISGTIRPGQMVALMGPSGSGKTTLLTLLAGRMKPGVTGSITYNGLPFTKPMKRKIGFVLQHDYVLQNLTVRETLVYEALLRLPSSFTSAEKVQRADDVISQLGLQRCKDTVLGGTFVRGVSGGEKKRVCIGQELLTDPSLLFLDEPTSGLDSTTAIRLISLLRDLAQSGKCVLTTIHQPSSSAFAMFDKLLLLTEGSPVYFGRAGAALNYFAELGYFPKFATNPADFLLDLASGVTHDMLPSSCTADGQEEGPLTQPREAHMSPEGQHVEAAKQKEVKAALKKAFVDRWTTGTSVRANSGLLSATLKSEEGILLKKEWPTTWLDQFLVLLVRGMKERKKEVLEFSKVFQVLAISIACGLLWWRTRLDTPRSVQDQTGLLFFITNFWGFFPLIGAVATFPSDRVMLSKERAAGMYRLSAYFMARILSDLHVVLILPALSMGAAVYWMTGLRVTAAAYFCTILTLLTNVLVSQGLGLAVGAILIKDSRTATTMAAVTMLIFMLAGGYFVQGIPVWISWFKYLSFPFYVFRLLVKVQYPPGTTYGCPTAENPHLRCPMEQSQALHGISLGGGLLEIGVLVFMLFFYRLVTYLFLRRLKPLN